MKKNDFTMSVIKSLKPISFSYSRQSKEYEKYFSGSNLKHLLKSVNKKAKTNTSIFNNPLFFDQIKNDSNMININIKSSFNYITDLSSLNNFPLSMIKKRKNYDEYIAKMNLFHELFYITKEKLVDMEFRKKRGERIKKKYELQKLNGVKETTLDPGKYYPKYDIVQKRYPVAFLGESNEERKKNLFVKNRIVTKNEYVKRKNKIYREKDENLDFKNQRKINPYSTMYKSNSEKDILNIEKLNMNDIYFKNQTNDRFYSNNINKKNIIHNYNKKKLSKCYSAENINKVRCPIVFNKMPGRDRKVVIEPYFNEINYSPNYEFIRPHVPATIFKPIFDCQKFKNYMTGKIIRSYCFTPDKYFVFEVNQNKDKNKNFSYK